MIMSVLRPRRAEGARHDSNDPVCGRELDTRNAPVQVHHKDGTYFFCSQVCARTFLENPEQFVDTARDDAE